MGRTEEVDGSQDEHCQNGSFSKGQHRWEGEVEELGEGRKEELLWCATTAAATPFD